MRLTHSNLEQAILYPSPKGYSIQPTLVALGAPAG